MEWPSSDPDRSPAVFVGGPIQHALRDANGVPFDPSLRGKIERVLAELEGMGAEVFSAHVLERFGVLTETLGPEEVTERDYRWMRACNIFVAVIPKERSGLPYRTDGTFIEIGWAAAMSKPIVLMTDGTPPDGAYSHLVRGLTTVTTVNFVDLKGFLANPQPFRDLVRGLLGSPNRTARAQHAHAS